MFLLGVLDVKEGFRWSKWPSLVGCIAILLGIFTFLYTFNGHVNP